MPPDDPPQWLPGQPATDVRGGRPGEGRQPSEHQHQHQHQQRHSGQRGTGGRQPGHRHTRQFGRQPPQQSQPPQRPDVDGPTLQWVRLTHPRQRFPLGESDHVLESVFDAQRGAWEALVLFRPSEADDGE